MESSDNRPGEAKLVKRSHHVVTHTPVATAQAVLNGYLAAIEADMVGLYESDLKQVQALGKKKRDAKWAFGHLRNALRQPLEEIELGCFVGDGEALTRCLQHVSIKGSSRRVCKTIILWVLEWGLFSGSIPIEQTMTRICGFPDYQAIRDAVGPELSLHGYELLVRFICSKRLTLGGLTTEDIDAFLETFRSNTTKWRQFYGQMTQAWAIAMSAGLLPAVPWPEIKPLKTPKMKIRFDELPESLQKELVQVLERFRGDFNQPPRLDRSGRPKKQVQKSTVHNREEQCLRHFGFLDKHLGLDLEGRAFAELMSFDRVMARCRYTNGDKDLSWDGIEHLPMGRYQKETFEECAAILRCVEGGSEEAQKIDDFVRYNNLYFEEKREPQRQIPQLDDAFRVAYVLSIRSFEEEQGGNLLEASRLRRDAVIFTMIGCFASRTGVLSEIDNEKHVSLDNDGAPCVLTVREITKRQLVDGLYEMPEETRGLFRHYELRDRPRLADGKKLDSFLVSDFATSMGEQSVYRVVAKRSEEVLGREICPRAIRKAWAHGFVKYSNGDFITAAAIMDTSVAQVQKIYAAGRDAELTEKFDSQTINGRKTA